jgi:peptidoglycan/xylan/chitin deacetylase (PgdA/CDA1 family)
VHAIRAPRAGGHAPDAEAALPPALVYHKIERGFELGVNVVSPSAFRRHVEWFASRGWSPRAIGEAVARRRAHGAGHAAGARLVGLTFDDGYAGIAEHAVPLLASRGFTATVFVPSDYVGRGADWDTGLLGRRFRHLDAAALRDLVVAGFEIGSHSATHRDLRSLDDDALRRETAGSRRALEDLAGAPVRSFAYPFGRHDARVRAAVADAGYEIACGGFPDGASPDGRLVHVARFGVRSVDGVRALAAKLGGGSRRAARFERLKERVAYVAAGGTPWARSHLPFLP